MAADSFACESTTPGTQVSVRAKKVVQRVSKVRVLPHFSFVLRALLTNAPNSCPPESLFSMFNATFGEDQRRDFGDYLELSMQSQYNKRNL